MAICPNCGKQIKSETDFCPYCNEELIENRREYSGYRHKNISRNNVISRSSERKESSNRTKRLAIENKKLRKTVAILTISLAGTGILAIVLAIGFITSAMNVSSLTLKAKNTEEKLESIMSENSRLKEGTETDTYLSDDNPFKADIEAAQTTTVRSQSSDMPVLQTENVKVEEVSETTTEAKTEATTEHKEEVTEVQPVQQEPQLESEPEETPAEEAEEEFEQLGLDEIQDNNGIESYSPIIPD